MSGSLGDTETPTAALEAGGHGNAALTRAGGRSAKMITSRGGLLFAQKPTQRPQLKQISAVLNQEGGTSTISMPEARGQQRGDVSGCSLDPKPSPQGTPSGKDRGDTHLEQPMQESWLLPWEHKPFPTCSC